MRPDDRWLRDLEKALPPVPDAGPDLRRRIEAIADRPVRSASVAPRWFRPASLTAAMAASVLLFLATPKTATPPMELSAEEHFVLDTFTTALDDGGDTVLSGGAWMDEE